MNAAGQRMRRLLLSQPAAAYSTAGGRAASSGGPRHSRSTAAAVAAAAAAAATLVWIGYSLGRRSSGGVAQADTDGAVEAAPAWEKWGLPEPAPGVVVRRKGYTLGYDTRTRNAAFVMERLVPREKKRPPAASREQSAFREDPAVDPLFRARLGDYDGSGYDRGHLVPAGDFPDDQEAMDETFLLGNVSPQVGRNFNRDYWARLERFARDLTSEGRCESVHVVTGPLYLPQRRKGDDWELRIRLLGGGPGRPGVYVPTHFFKAIACERSPASVDASGGPAVAVGAVVVPNAPVPAETELTDFVRPLEEVEAAAGFRLFPALGVRLGGAASELRVTEQRHGELCDAVVCRLPPGYNSNRRSSKSD